MYQWKKILSWPHRSILWMFKVVKNARFHGSCRSYGKSEMTFVTSCKGLRNTIYIYQSPFMTSKFGKTQTYYRDVQGPLKGNMNCHSILVCFIKLNNIFTYTLNIRHSFNIANKSFSWKGHLNLGSLWNWEFLFQLMFINACDIPLKTMDFKRSENCILCKYMNMSLFNHRSSYACSIDDAYALLCMNHEYVKLRLLF